MSTKQKHNAKQAWLWQWVVTLVVFGGLSVLLARSGHSLLEVGRTLHVTDLVAGVPLMSLTFLLAASSYRVLSFRRLRLGQLVLIELAAACVNRIIPAGLGSLSLHGRYLQKQGLSLPQTVAMVSVNNLIGLIMHIALLAVLLTTSGGFDDLYSLGWDTKQGWILAGMVFVVVVGVVMMPRVRTKIRNFMTNLGSSLRRYQKQPHKLLYAAVALLALTLVNVTLLQFLAISNGIYLSVPQIFVAYSVGVMAGTASPTPGGLVGAEAGLGAGLVWYGADLSAAIVVVLAFRLLTYWLPIIPGAMALYVARRRGLL